jgi:hypothetical protein
MMGMESGFFKNLPKPDFGFQARKSRLWILKSKTQTITFQNPKSGFFNLKI